MANSSESSSNSYLKVKEESEKYIIMYTLLKLNLISGKIVIYTNTKSAGYRLRLYLEEFHIKVLLLNYELPKATRHLSITNFVKTCDVLIVIDPDEKESKNKNTKRHKIYKIPVSVLINFDFPTSYRTFKKRISDVLSDLNSDLSILSLIHQEESLLQKINKKLNKLEKAPIEILPLKNEQFERFSYRCEDILRSISLKTIEKSQLDDVKKAILSVGGPKSGNSRNKLELSAEDKQILADAKKKHKPLKHLASVPDYLLPEPLRKNAKPHKVNKKTFEQKLAKRQNREPAECGEEYIEEAPENIAWQDLAPTSNRKLWKIRHHFSISATQKRKRRL